MAPKEATLRNPALKKLLKFTTSLKVIIQIKTPNFTAYATFSTPIHRYWFGDHQLNEMVVRQRYRQHCSYVKNVCYFLSLNVLRYFFSINKVCNCF